MKIIERLELGEYATFKPNKELPRHRWFYFKEGFSRDLVHYLLKKYDVDSGDWVLDPFMGVGTTPLTCREYG
ncbi:TPA: site-specific DNA-methyltransferase, partial [Candidatus Geothermarchaeota archaeon]|nr:site-specific DNA-methyltransferase [Candidatus Geothermarchaeota archaeon]